MRNIIFLKCLCLQGVGTEGSQGPPGKEGQRVSDYHNNCCALTCLSVTFFGKTLVPMLY